MGYTFHGHVFLIHKPHDPSLSQYMPIPLSHILGGETTSGAKRLGGRLGRKRLGDETTRGGNGLG